MTWERLLLDSFAESLLRSSECPVLLVRHDPKGTAKLTSVGYVYGQIVVILIRKLTSMSFRQSSHAIWRGVLLVCAMTCRVHHLMSGQREVLPDRAEA